MTLKSAGLMGAAIIWSFILLPLTAGSDSCSTLRAALIIDDRSCHCFFVAEILNILDNIFWISIDFKAGNTSCSCLG